MNFFTNLKASFIKILFLVMAACALTVSCYDDSELREQIDLIVDKIFELETKLNNEIDALSEMIKGKALISSVSTDVDGVTTIILSNGTELTLYPESDMEAFITYMPAAINGKNVDCWAYIDEQGVKRYMRDSEGNPIPVESEVPEVVEIDGESYLVIGGNSYPLSGNSVFSDYEIIKDELTGEVYAVTFTFGDDMTFTVTVDGACGFYFVANSGGFGQINIINDYYVANGLTEKVQISALGVVDYVLQVPDGWRIKETEDVFGGEKVRYFDITAPSKELVSSGIAVSEGELKVVAVLEGGKATVSKLYLSSDPFRNMSVSLGKAYVDMFNGLQKFVYGVCAKEDYDEDALFDVAGTLLDKYSYPAGFGLSTSALAGVPVADILGSQPVDGEEYVFWALPVLYDMNAEEAPYYLKEGTFVQTVFKNNSVKLEVSGESFRDAVLSMELKGVDAYYAELLPKDEFLMEDILFYLNNSYLDPVTEPMSYEGSVFEFAGMTASSDTEYVLWLAVAEEGRTYSEADVLVCGFATLDVVAGGSVEVVAGEDAATPVAVSVPLAAEGAEYIYYTFMTPAAASKLEDDEAKAQYLFDNGLMAAGESVDADSYDVLSKQMPETSLVLLAVATASDGKYGQVLTHECATSAITYNELTVDIQLVTNDPNNVSVALSCDGGEAAGYLYWIGKTSDNTWKSSSYLGGSAETAQSYMYLNADNARFTNIAEKYPVADGVITMTDLQLQTEYVIVAMAEDSKGGFSKAKELKFTTRPVAIGNVVTSSDPRWESARPVVEWIDNKFEAATGMMSGQYACTVKLPADMTGYILLSTDYELCDSDQLYEIPVDDKIVTVMQLANSKRDSDVPDPSISEEVFNKLVWPEGSIFYHHEHGNPLYGNAVVWANEEFHESVCGCQGSLKTSTVANGKTVPLRNVFNYNDGNPVEFRQPQAIASTKEVIDKVYIVCQDLEGNCYETYVFDVPFEKFKNAGGRGE